MGNRSTEISEKESLNLVNTSYSYSLDNLLQSVTKGTNTTAMTYYADGLRAAKSTSAATTHYIYDLSGRLMAKGQNATSVSANYVWGPDRVLSKKDSSGGEYYYLYNGHGDVIQIVDRNGNVVNNYKYDEWGNILTSSETISNPFLYAGEVYDRETGLYYLRARYYDPSMGRFINEDSIEGQVNNPLTLNLYTYCANNPMIYIDPSGNIVVPVPYDDGPVIFPFPWDDNSSKNIFLHPYPGLVNADDKNLGDILADGLDQLAKAINDGIKGVKKVFLLLLFLLLLKLWKLYKVHLK